MTCSSFSRVAVLCSLSANWTAGCGGGGVGGPPPPACDPGSCGVSAEPTVDDASSDAGSAEAGPQRNGSQEAAAPVSDEAGTGSADAGVPQGSSGSATCAPDAPCDGIDSCTNGCYGADCCTASCSCNDPDPTDPKARLTCVLGC